MENIYFEKLDNTANLYAANTTYKTPNVYRISVKTTEVIKEAILKEALEKTLISIPNFKVKLRKGFFWHYFEANNSDVIVEEDSSYPCQKINIFSNNLYLFKVTYFNRNINLEVSHILADGAASLNFLKSLINNYFKLKHSTSIKENVVDVENFSKNEMKSDSFIRYSKENFKHTNKLKYTPAYKISDPKNFYEPNIILATLSTKELKALSKKYDTTITILLISLLIQSIYDESYKFNQKNKPISICVPVNLRTFFKSESMNNFFNAISSSVNFYKKTYSFEEILVLVRDKMKEDLTKENLAFKFKTTVAIQESLLLRIMPVFIKNLILKISYQIGEVVSTSSLSNLGIVDFGDETNKYIENIYCMLCPEKTQPIKIGVVSFKDKITINFSNILNNTEIERNFIKALTTAGLNVTLNNTNFKYAQKIKKDNNLKETLEKKITMKKIKDKKTKAYKNKTKNNKNNTIK